MWMWTWLKDLYRVLLLAVVVVALVAAMTMTSNQISCLQLELDFHP